MPRLVDHQRRREEIGQAAWRVVRRDGLPAVSVRSVAREAATTPSALRHYFPSQHALLEFAMRHVVDRVTDRVRRLAPTGTRIERTLAHLEQVLPLDAERRAEGEVWLAFTAAAQHDAALHQLRDAADAGVHFLCATVARALLGADTPESTLEAATQRLWALVDGVTLHLLVAPSRTSAADARTMLREHLELLSNSDSR